jgi:hypothetical protein
MATTPLIRHRWFSYRLRSILLLVAALAVGLAWCVNEAHRQRTVVSAINAAGGSVVYDYMQHPDRPLGRTRFGQVPKWIIDLLGHDFFASVINVRIPKPTDELMIHVGKLRSLQSFDGNYDQMSEVSDTGAGHLTKLKLLNHILLSSDLITDDSLRNFGKMPQLQGLQFRSKQITDEGIAHLSSLKQLFCLRLSNARITDDGLRALSGHEKLRVLDLDGTHVTGTGLSHLGCIATLEFLNLERAPVNDSGLATVARFAKLRGVSLAGTNITSAGLAHLQSLPALNSVNLSDTRITDEAWQYLADIGTLQEVIAQKTPVLGWRMEQLNKVVALRGVWLNGTRVTDAALEPLHIRRLGHLGLLGTKVSASWVERNGHARVTSRFQPYIDY